MNKLKSDQIARDQLQAILSTYSRALLRQIYNSISGKKFEVDLENEEIVEAILNEMGL